MPQSVEALVRESAREGESFSATVTRLIEEGARLVAPGRMPSYVGSADGPDDMGIRAEEYLRELFAKR